ncbi:MAG: hypothetical protein VXZ99_12645 [Pseudomonadota bacterium]|nr:hypothetical protein [Pseudomonadota bacterium]MEC8698208.1 hypothetical protein [Pseudomonadota bacterium]MED6312120.1 hypothetical protein [Pseudomonadota bacterium]
MKSIEFEQLNLERGFEEIPGKLKITHKILTDTLDHEAKTGMRKPGCENGSFVLTPASNRLDNTTSRGGKNSPS